MNNILCIGSSGYLGSYLTDRFKCITTAKRFQWSPDVWRYDLAHQYDFVFLVARTCRKQHPRRDRLTMMDEVGGMIKVFTKIYTWECRNFWMPIDKAVKQTSSTSSKMDKCN